MDSTHIKANANKRIFTRDMAHKEAILYQKQLEEEINEARIAEGKRPFGQSFVRRWSKGNLASQIQKVVIM